MEILQLISISITITSLTLFLVLLMGSSINLYLLKNRSKILMILSLIGMIAASINIYAYYELINETNVMAVVLLLYASFIPVTALLAFIFNGFKSNNKTNKAEYIELASDEYSIASFVDHVIPEHSQIRVLTINKTGETFLITTAGIEPNKNIIIGVDRSVEEGIITSYICMDKDYKYYIHHIFKFYCVFLFIYSLIQMNQYILYHFETKLEGEMVYTRIWVASFMYGMGYLTSKMTAEGKDLMTKMLHYVFKAFYIFGIFGCIFYTFTLFV